MYTHTHRLGGGGDTHMDRGKHTQVEGYTLRSSLSGRKTETKVNRSHFFPFPYFAVNYTLIRVDLYVESFGKIEEVNMV